MSTDAMILSMDALPTEAHRHLCRLGHRDDISGASVRDYASRYRAFLGVVIARHPGVDPNTLVAHVTAAMVRAYADDLVIRIGAKRARETLIKLRAALVAIFPELSLPCFRVEYARLRQLPACERHAFRYAIAISEIPSALRELFVAIDDAHVAERKAPSDASADGAEAPTPDTLQASAGKRLLKNRPALHRILRRYLGALAQGGVDLATLTPATLVTVPHLDIYLARATDGASGTHVAQCLYSLKSALRTIDASQPIAEILARHDIVAPERNTDYQTFVPAEDRALLEQALSRLCLNRSIDEPGPLDDNVAAKVRFSLGAFFRHLQEEPAIPATPSSVLDVSAAVYRYESRKTALKTATLVTRLTEIKAGLDRISYERGGTPSTEAIGARIADLKRHIVRPPLELPEDIGPRDIERLGRKLVWTARSRLLDLLATRHPYRNTLRLAEHYRDGVIFIMFSLLVLRVSNMAALLFGKLLGETGQTWSIAIPGTLTKNGMDIFQTLPSWIGALVEEFKNTIRPLIAEIEIGVNDHVFWLARHGGPLRPGGFQDIVPRHALKAFEVDLYCHLLRAIEASDALESMDAAAGYGMSGLRDNDPKVVRKYYQDVRVLQRTPAKLPGVRAIDAALPKIDPDRVVIGPAPRVPKVRKSRRASRLGKRSLAVSSVANGVT